MLPVSSVLRRSAVLVGLLLCFVLLGLISVPAAWAQTGPAAPAGPSHQQEQSPDIIGGREAAPGAWPWQVALVYRFSSEAYAGFFCGGSLIAPDWVLTAAHCIDEMEATTVDVLVGTNLLSANAPRIPVDAALMNGAYVRGGLDGDIALLHLAQPVTQTTIALFDPAADGVELDYRRGTVTGWGNTDPSSLFGVYPDALQEVSLPLVDTAACSRRWENEIGSRIICAGYPTMTKSACYGDSGGPLMVQQADGRWLQVGIVKAGEAGCPAGVLPNLFTRVASYRDWVTACVQDSNSRACTGADAYEVDDTPSAAGLYSTFGVSQTHTLHQKGDQDWIKFDVQAGHLYQIQTTYPFTLLGRLDTVVWLFADEGHTPLAYNDDYPFVGDPQGDTIHDALLSWRASEDGQLYASVENLAGVTGATFPYGPDVRYTLTIYDYAQQTYLPAVLQPEPTRTPLPSTAAQP